MLAISSGRDLCFDHGRGGLQSIKPWPGLGKGLSTEGGAFRRSKGEKGHGFGLVRRQGGVPRCWLSWKLKIPKVRFIERNFSVAKRKI